MHLQCFHWNTINLAKVFYNVALAPPEQVLQPCELHELEVAALSERAVDEAASSKLCEDPYDLKTGRPEDAALGLKILLNADLNKFDRLTAMGTDGIVEEVEKFIVNAQQLEPTDLQCVFTLLTPSLHSIL